MTPDIALIRKALKTKIIIASLVMSERYIEDDIASKQEILSKMKAILSDS
jgi:hypothetical protein|tara:strand:- start:992 stop:1141 length:150 start_codon:yes stop_codon:yes gene_type:complete